MQSEQVAKIRELEAQGQIMHFREKWRTEFDKRRKLHNVVLELKGNIRVLCRVRPMLDKERGGLDAAAAAASMPVRCPTEETVRVAAVDNKAEKEFEFDRVLSPEEGQDKVSKDIGAAAGGHGAGCGRRGVCDDHRHMPFTERSLYEFAFTRFSRTSSRVSLSFASPALPSFPHSTRAQLYDEVAALVVSVLDGYNVAIMAYGQTGSGKTFTMEGPEGNPGVNLRALGDLFRLAEERAAEYAFSFSASVLEIYNEQIYDLLMNGAQDGDKLDVKQVRGRHG